MTKKRIKGKSVYLTYDELWWIHSTMMNQDAFGNDDHEAINDSIYKKTGKAIDLLVADEGDQS